MLPHDPTGENGVSRDLPDAIKVHDPDKDDQFDQPYGGGGGSGAAVQPQYMTGAPATDVRNIDNPPQTDNQPPQTMDDQPQQQYDQGPPQNQGFDQPQQYQQPQQTSGGFDQQY